MKAREHSQENIRQVHVGCWSGLFQPIMISLRTVCRFVRLPPRPNSQVLSSPIDHARKPIARTTRQLALGCIRSHFVYICDPPALPLPWQSNTEALNSQKLTAPPTTWSSHLCHSKLEPSLANVGKNPIRTLRGTLIVSARLEGFILAHYRRTGTMLPIRIIPPPPSCTS